MPLVLLCGYPSSGKTTLALQLKAFLDEKSSQQQQVNFKNVQVVNEEFLKLSSNDYYMSMCLQAGNDDNNSLSYNIFNLFFSIASFNISNN